MSAQGRLSFASDLKSAVSEAEVVFIAVGTPSRRGDGHADLSYVYAAAREIAGVLPERAVVVTKSTVPVGTGDEVERIIREENPDATVAVVSNPEFLREGAAIRDFKHPDRIVIGTDDARARGVMAEVYRPLHLNASPILYTDRRTAELTKYAANSFLATKIAFINEIADLAEKVGANVQEVARGIGLDNRIGQKFLHAGPGFGGSCFPKDAMALIKTGQDNESPVRIVETVVAVNDQRKRAMARKVANAFGGNLRGKSIAVLGVTFKPDTDDMRDAPSIPLDHRAAGHGRRGSHIRSRRHGAGEEGVRERHLQRERLPLRQRLPRARHRHRMGAVSRAGPEGIVRHHGLPGHRRSAQHLLAGGGGAERLSVLRRGSAEIGGVLIRMRRHDIGWLGMHG